MGIVIVALLVFTFVIGLTFWFAFGGGVLFLPNPPKPSIKSAEFDFSLKYDEGRGKTRRWKEYYKNKQKNELFAYPYGNLKYHKPQYDQILLQDIEQYKIVFATESAEYFMGEPEYKGTDTKPYIQVFDTNIGYYKDTKESEIFLEEHGFKIIEWQCDSPIKNSFE